MKVLKKKRDCRDLTYKYGFDGIKVELQEV